MIYHQGAVAYLKPLELALHHLRTTTASGTEAEMATLVVSAATANE